MKLIIGLALLLGILGCARISDDLHPWQTSGGAYYYKTDVTRWTTIESWHLGKVGLDYNAKACNLLNETDAVEISIYEASEMCPNAQFDFGKHLKPFLIRGLAYDTGITPGGIVKYEEQSGIIYFYQESSLADYFPPWGFYEPKPAPIVILLKNKPSKVICAAFTSYNYRETDTIRREDSWYEWRP